MPAAPWSILNSMIAVLAADPVVLETRRLKEAERLAGQGPRAAPGVADGKPTPALIRSYLAKCPPAVAGQFVEGKKGHDRTIYTAGKLIRGFNLSPDEAFPFMLEWNAKCVPPWSEKDLYRKLTEATKRPGPRGTLLKPGAVNRAMGEATRPAVRLSNYYVEEVQDGETMKVIRRGRSEADIFEDLTNFTGGWPKRLPGYLFVRGEEETGVRLLHSVNDFFAWIGCQFGTPGRRGIDWTSQLTDGCTKAEFFAYCLSHAESYEAVESGPHVPQLAGHYYDHPDLDAFSGDGQAFEKLLTYFTPADIHDLDLLRGLFLTLVWGGPPGRRPIFLITTPENEAGAGRGTGKSALAQLASRLVGGSIQLRQDEDFSRFVSRLLSKDGLTKRVLMVDNIKSTKFSRADLESLITTDVISGHQWYEGEGRRPNILTTILTVNGPALSKDIAQRCIPIRLCRPDYFPKWEEEVTTFIDVNRWAILADLVAELKKPAGRTDKQFRWGLWQGDILSRLPDPDQLVERIIEWQGAADEDQVEAEAILEAIVQEVQLKVMDSPENHKVFISAKELARIAFGASGEKRSTNSWSRYIQTLGVRGLKKTAGGDKRGWYWIGSDCVHNSNVDTRLE